jgi:hypothetical protein
MIFLHHLASWFATVYHNWTYGAVHLWCSSFSHLNCIINLSHMYNMPGNNQYYGAIHIATATFV